MISSLKSEFYKFGKNKIYFICLGIILLIVPFAVYTMQDISENIVYGLNGAGVIINRIGDNIPIFIISISIASFVASEFQTGRVRIILSHIRYREVFYLSKFVVCITGMIFANFLNLALYCIIATMGWGFDPSGVFSLNGFFVFCFLQILILCAYASMFVCISFVTESYGHSLAINILVIMFIPNILNLVDKTIGTNLYNYWPEVLAMKAATYSPSLTIVIQVCVGSMFIILLTTVFGCWRLKNKEI